MIVKNEEEHLPLCLKSVEGLVDEIIIVDTGSSDRTLEIAKEFGATIVQTTWENDFSKARNLSLNKSNTEWILYLDADEEFMGNPINIRQQIKEQKKIGYWMTIKSLTSEEPPSEIIHSSLRVFKVKENFYFSGVIHEDILPSILEKYTLDSLGELEAYITHKGYLPTIMNQRNKVERNFSILKASLQTNPNQPYYLYHLGICLDQVNEVASAITCFNQALQLTTKEISFRPSIIKDLAKTLIKVKSYSEAIEMLEQELHLYNDYPDLYALLGDCYQKVNADDKAIQMYQEAVKLTTFNKKYISESGLSTYIAWTNMGEVAIRWEAYTDALNYFNNALQHQPTYTPALTGIADILVASKMEPKIIEETLKKIYKEINKGGPIPRSQQLVLAKVLFFSGCDDEFIDCIRNIEDLPLEITLDVIKSFIYSGKWEEAIKITTYLLNSPNSHLVPFEIISPIILYIWKQKIDLSKEIKRWIANQSNSNFYETLRAYIMNNQQPHLESMEWFLFVQKHLKQAITYNQKSIINKLIILHSAFQLFSAKILYYDGFIHEASEYLEQLYHDKSLDAEGLFLYGEYLYSIQDWERSALVFEKSLQKNPDNKAAHIGVALTYLHQANLLAKEGVTQFKEFPLFTAYQTKLELSMELTNKICWKTQWRGRQRRNVLNG